MNCAEKIIRANNLLQFIHEVTIEFRFRKSLARDNLSPTSNLDTKSYEGQSKLTEPYLITFELSKMDIYLDDISLKLYVIYLIT